MGAARWRGIKLEIEFQLIFWYTYSMDQEQSQQINQSSGSHDAEKHIPKGAIIGIIAIMVIIAVGAGAYIMLNGSSTVDPSGNINEPPLTGDTTPPIPIDTNTMQKSQIQLNCESAGGVYSECPEDDPLAGLCLPCTCPEGMNWSFGTNECQTITVASNGEIDSDGDGLSDYDEENIHGTHPHNPDTDNDGFSDGQEVENGYDPLVGSGSSLNCDPEVDCFLYTDFFLF